MSIAVKNIVLSYFVNKLNKNIYDEALANKHTLNWDSKKFRTRRGIEPRASWCPFENINKNVLNTIYHLYFESMYAQIPG